MNKQRAILIVEDNEDVIEMEKIMFEEEGYAVTPETNPLSAVSTFRRNPHAFDLIITDLAMPEMSGLQFIESVRTIRQSIPIMLLTGCWDVVSGETARALDIAVAHKPIRKHELFDWVRRLTEGTRNHHPRKERADHDQRPPSS